MNTNPTTSEDWKRRFSIVRAIRELPCPNCLDTTHSPVDVDGEGEWFRVCESCGENFHVEDEQIAAALV